MFNLESLSLEPCLHLHQGLLLHLVNGLLDGALVADRGAEHTQCSVLDILGQVRLNLLGNRFIVIQLQSKDIPCSSPLILALAASSNALLFPAPLVVAQCSAMAREVGWVY